MSFKAGIAALMCGIALVQITHGVTVRLGIAATALRLSHFSLATGVHLHFLITTLRQLALVLASQGAFERATRGGLLLSGVLW